MYTKSDSRDVEAICYEEQHIEKVLTIIRENFNSYFDRYIATKAGNGLTDTDISKLEKKFGIKSDKKTREKNLTNNYKEIIAEAYENFEHDREAYLKIFDVELLEDYDTDAETFKSKVLKCECPIIRKTLQNKKAKELDKYRSAFARADADWLREIVYNLCVFGDAYQESYDPETYENIKSYKALKMGALDTDDYTAFGVIGGGIKTHMLYKVYPSIFSNRSRNALWALWFLSGKQTFGCKTDSEFLMIDIDKSITQQNYLYPYELFSFYAFEIYKMLRDKANEYNVYLDPDYRYVIVDSFLEYVAFEHDACIAELKAQIKDGGIGYA